jgi:hypothetical protein
VQKDGTTQIVNEFDPDEENGEITGLSWTKMKYEMT